MDIEGFVEHLKTLPRKKVMRVYETWFGTPGDEQEWTKEELIDEMHSRMNYGNEMTDEEVQEIIEAEMPKGK